MLHRPQLLPPTHFPYDPALIPPKHPKQPLRPLREDDVPQVELPLVGSRCQGNGDSSDLRKLTTIARLIADDCR